MLITAHWSATGPYRINDYHVEYGAKNGISAALNQTAENATDPSQVDWKALKAAFNVWKNTQFGTPTDYGTWHLNHDPRDGSANIEVGALCMGGEGVSITGPWGAYPYTYAHGWMHAAIIARICFLKKIDPNSSFPVSVEPGVLQNGPIYSVSTHAERALQTQDSAAVLRPTFGYFAYSGDGDCRWDIACRDVKDAPKLAKPADAKTEALANAAWLRHQTAAILKTLTPKSSMWGLDK